MSVYDGPAVLIDADASEIPVHALLAVHAEPIIIDWDGPHPVYAPGWRWWDGLLEGKGAAFPGHWTILRAQVFTLRLPGGRQGRVFEMSRCSDQPDRIEIKGMGEAPWDWE